MGRFTFQQMFYSFEQIVTLCIQFPSKGRRSRSRSPDSRGSTPIQDHGDKDYRYGVDISSQPPSLSSIVKLPPHSENYRPRPPPRPRCRDFDGKFKFNIDQISLSSFYLFLTENRMECCIEIFVMIGN